MTAYGRGQFGDQGQGGGRGQGGDKGRPTRPRKAIDQKDSVQEVDDFCPLCEPGPHILSNVSDDDVCLLSLFFDDWAMERIHSCTLAYAESKK